MTSSSTVTSGSLRRTSWPPMALSMWSMTSSATGKLRQRGSMDQSATGCLILNSYLMTTCIRRMSEDVLFHITKKCMVTQIYRFVFKKTFVCFNVIDYWTVSLKYCITFNKRTFKLVEFSLFLTFINWLASLVLSYKIYMIRTVKPQNVYNQNIHETKLTRNQRDFRILAYT